MDVEESLKHLFNRYKTERSNANMSKELFEQIILIFPAILVAQADGHVDTTEILHLNKLVQHICSQNPNIVEQEFKVEMRYLTWNSSVWRLPILNFLKIYIETANITEKIIELMVSTAASSTGSLIGNLMMPSESQSNIHEYVSEDEKVEIMRIMKELNLTQNEELVKKVEFLIQGQRSES